MQGFWDMITAWGFAILDFFGDADNRDRSTAIAAVFGSLAAAAGIIWATLKFVVPPLFRKKTTPAPQIAAGQLVLTKETLDELLEGRIAKQVAAMEAAHGDEKAVFQAQIAELERQRANPDEALKEAQARITDLEARLEREGNEIGGDKLEAARKALRAGDTSLADDLFAEVEARGAPTVEASARAAFARGEIAEEEVRWADAAAHYARAARLAPDLLNLQKAAEFAQRAGDYPTARHLGDQALAMARKGDDQQALAAMLNNHATTLGKMGKFDEAEALYRQALEIAAVTIGKVHPDYASGLNNLAVVLRAMGKYDESEALYRQALEIDAVTIGEKHPDYATRLNNLATVLESTGKYDEAEVLYRQALEIDAETIGEKHPDNATRLNNLAGVLQATGKYDEAEALYRQAMEIDAATIGEKHPDYAADLNNLAKLFAETGRVEKAFPMAEQAMAIWEASFGPEHPDTIVVRDFLAAMRRDAQA